MCDQRHPELNPTRSERRKAPRQLRGLFFVPAELGLGMGERESGPMDRSSHGHRERERAATQSAVLPPTHEQVCPMDSKFMLLCLLLHDTLAPPRNESQQATWHVGALTALGDLTQ
jgi:hypothetical protein